MNIRTILLTAITLWASMTTFAEDAPVNKDDEMRSMALAMLPEATEGFEWQLYKNTAILKPEGWNQQQAADNPEQKTYGALAFSPESFSESQTFEHGFTAQILGNFKAANNTPASTGIALLIKRILDQHGEKSILMFEDGKSKLGETLVLRYKDTTTGATPIIVHKYFIISDSADSIHIFTYESSEQNWQKNWSTYGESIFSKIAVIPFLPAA